MTEHIDSRRLNEDLRYRFEYISKFLNFTNDDISSLNSFASIALPLMPVIVDAVYRKLFQFDITKNFFVLRNDGFDGELKDNQTFTLDSAQMTYRRDMLSEYLKRLLLQNQWTDDFLQYLSRVGKIHTGSQSMHVDYIHINATLSYIETHLIDIVWMTENLGNKTKKDTLMALNKVFRIQNDLFILHYLHSMNENTSLYSTDHQKTDKCVCS
jgi:hypothetical protein